MTPTAAELLQSPSFAAKRVDEQLYYIIMIIKQKQAGEISFMRYEELFGSAYDILWRWQLHYLNLITPKP